MLRFDMQILGAQGAVFDHLGQALDHRRLRGDRVGGNHMWSGEPDPKRHGFVAGHKCFVAGHSHKPPLRIRMAPNWHSWAQIPQPLQKS